MAKLDKESCKRIMSEVEKEHDAHCLAKKKALEGEFFPMDGPPDSNCPFCLRSGFVGYFKNGKKIPCRCTIESNDGWLVLYHKIILESGATKDSISKVLTKKKIKKKSRIIV